MEGKKSQKGRSGSILLANCKKNRVRFAPGGNSLILGQWETNCRVAPRIRGNRLRHRSEPAQANLGRAAEGKKFRKSRSTQEDMGFEKGRTLFGMTAVIRGIFNHNRSERHVTKGKRKISVP